MRLKTNSGIDLSKKKSLIVSRLSNTLKAGGYTSFSQYIDDVIYGRDKDMVTSMLNKLTTNYTYFLREREHFDFFKDTILPYLVSTKKNKSLSIWSAGCSSGEEPYTISMFIKDFLGQQASAWDTRILATDISTDVLSIAMKGEYDVKSLRDVPDSWKKRFFRPVKYSDKGVHPLR